MKSPGNEKPKAIGYSRVSTLAQKNDSQVKIIRERAEFLNWKILEVIEEKISGKTRMENRPGMIRLWELIRKYHVKNIIVYDVSRIGRNLLEAVKFIERLKDKNINVHILDLNLNTLENDRVNPATSLMINLMLSIADYQRSQIVEKVKIGLEEAKKNGTVLGRRKGYRKSEKIFLNENKEAIKMLKAGISIRETANLVKKSKNTIQKLKQLINRDSLLT